MSMIGQTTVLTDIHTETAARMFGVPPGSVTATQRSAAKARNYAEMYGSIRGRSKSLAPLVLELSKLDMQQLEVRLTNLKSTDYGRTLEQLHEDLLRERYAGVGLYSGSLWGQGC